MFNNLFMGNSTVLTQAFFTFLQSGPDLKMIDGIFQRTSLWQFTHRLEQFFAIE